MKLNLRHWIALASMGALIAGFPCSLHAAAADLRIKAQLAWGTNDSKPPDKELHELDPKIREKFRPLRWKNYFVIQSKNAAIAGKAVQRIALSEKCALEVRDMADGNLEIKILGGKVAGQLGVIKTEVCPIAKLKAGHIFAYAGETKEKWDDAWLVIVTSEN
jgi:hypothetical protein